MRKLIPLLGALALAAACKSGPEVAAAPALDPAASAKAAETAAAEKIAAEKAALSKAATELEAKAWKKLAVEESALDKSIDPCDDFYRFACGGWQKATPIPDDRPEWTRSFSVIAERNELALKEMMQDDAEGKTDPADPYAQKVGDFYATCMDEKKAETASLASLKEQLKQIDAIQDAKGLARAVAQLQLAGVSALFSFGSDQDAKDATQVIGAADQGGIGLPDRDFFLLADRKPILGSYESMLANLLKLSGEKEARAKADAKTTVRIETALAKAAMDKVERRDPYKVYHRIDRKGLVGAAPHFVWDTYFAEAGVPELTAINVAVPAFYAGLDQLLAREKLADLKTYLRAFTVSQASRALGKAFVDEQFNFISKLIGAKTQLPRWKRCVAATEAALGEAVGRSFVAKTFGAEGKTLSLALLNGIEAAFEANLTKLTWMDAATKKAAAEKMHKVVNKIGYPDQWRNYDAMKIGRTSFLDNLVAANVFESKRDVAKIGKKLDRGEWGMTAASVNAQYNPALNDITFPAGILQDPFFAAVNMPSTNAGGIGMVIGHELTHGFDDQGRQYDGDGNLRDWWTKQSGEAYNQRAECVAKQYDGYIAVDDVHLNGHLTNGENIADIGGLKLAYLALMASRVDKAPLPKVAGFDQEQQVFLGFAQSWCQNSRPQYSRLIAQTNPHSTAEWRVNGSVSDNADFARVFACKAGSKMAPVNRCEVW